MILHGQEGDDKITTEAAVLNVTMLTINGDAGNDLINANDSPLAVVNGVTINGDAGDDMIIGSPGADTINGGAGEDTMVGAAGADTFDGGADFDTILIEGTSGADVINVFQAAPTTLNHTVNGDAQVDTLVVNAGVGPSKRHASSPATVRT